MPEEAPWENLLDVPLILDRLGIDAQIGDVVELGCGYGTFTIPVARRIRGRVLAFDLEADMVARTQQRAREAGLGNILCQQRDVAERGHGMPLQSMDGCLLFNILHGEDPIKLLSQAAALVRPGGRLWAIHWRYEPATPRGPSMDIRPRPEQIADWAGATGLLERVGDLLDLPPWHYGWLFRRFLGEQGNPSSDSAANDPLEFLPWLSP
jgi:SAM-dependent methyltransferase